MHSKLFSSRLFAIDSVRRYTAPHLQCRQETDRIIHVPVRYCQYVETTEPAGITKSGLTMIGTWGSGQTTLASADGFGLMCIHYDQPEGVPPPPERYRGRRTSSGGGSWQSA